jgi:hypothetical protein
MNAILPIAIVSSIIIIIILAIAIKKRNSRNNKNNPDDLYNNFHLGEMTSHDIPARFTKREKEYGKWSSRQTKKTEVLKNLKKEGEDTNGQRRN